MLRKIKIMKQRQVKKQINKNQKKTMPLKRRMAARLELLKAMTSTGCKQFYYSNKHL